MNPLDESRTSRCYYSIPMRYAILSDIHSNLEALTAVLLKTSLLRTDRLLCLGDIVGYNANPNEVIDILKSEGAVCIKGNHDIVASGGREPDDFSPLAKEAILWTRQRLSAEGIEFLKRLPAEIEIEDFFIFHGSIHDTDRYILDTQDVRDNFSMLGGLSGAPRIGFFGHTHIRTAYSLYQGVLAIETSNKILIWDGKRYLINPGSVGQPRDRDPRASFCIYDTKERTVAFHRVEYDIRACGEKIIKAGLPPHLAERLEEGW